MAEKETTQRTQSTIQFPYKDMELGISVAQAMLDAGGVALTGEQLAGVMKMQQGSGAFASKVATAKIFGLVATVAGKYELTNLGFSIVDRDEKRRRSARVDSFLHVPLYKRTYDEFRGKQLPPKAGLEQAFVRFGVAPKQGENARWAFEKSARQAGFFASGDDRLIEPIVAGPSATAAVASEEPRAEAPFAPSPPMQHAMPTRSALHPFIQGLLDTLPAPETNWSVEGRAKWLQAAAHCFDLIYMGDGAIAIEAKATANRPSERPAPKPMSSIVGSRPIPKAELDDDIPT